MQAITIVLGTAREGRHSEKVARYLERLFRDRSDTVHFVDVRDHVHEPRTIPPWDEQGTKHVATSWQEIANNTDAFIFVVPEYNRGYPGEWKLLMDKLYIEYKRKHAYIVGVSDGQFAGVRVADHMKPVLVEFDLILHKAALFFAHVDEAFGDDGLPHDEAVRERAEKFVDTVLTTER